MIRIRVEGDVGYENQLGNILLNGANGSENQRVGIESLSTGFISE